MYTITLADGQQIRNLELNGNNYISKRHVDESIFTPTNLTRIAISDGKNEEVYENMAISNFWTQEDGTHIIFRELSYYEKMMTALEAKLDFVAMMTDVEV